MSEPLATVLNTAPRASLPERLTLDVAAATLAGLQSGLTSKVEADGTDFTVDASALRELDSSAVAVLLELRRQLQRQGRVLRLMDGPARLRELISLYGVAELLPT